MQKDCHYYGTFLMACMAGFSQAEAEVIAWASQTVSELDLRKLYEQKIKRRKDIPFFVTFAFPYDFVLGGIIRMRLLECKTLFRGIFLPFHYLPGNFPGAVNKKDIIKYNGPLRILPAFRKLYKSSDGVEMEDVGTANYNQSFTYSGTRGDEDMKLLCRTSTGMVKAIVDNAKKQYVRYAQKDTLSALCAVGIAMHALLDTWSHENFAGTPSYWVNDCGSSNNTRSCFFWKSKNVYSEYTNYQPNIMNSNNIQSVNSPLYTGCTVLDGLPDLPGAIWSGMHNFGVQKKYDNSVRFSYAMIQMLDALIYIKEQNSQAMGFDKEHYKQLLKQIYDDEAGNKLKAIVFSLRYDVLNFLDKQERVERWKNLLQKANISLQDYDFSSYNIISFVQMARAHRKAVFYFLEKNAGIYINLKAVDSLVKDGTMMLAKMGLQDFEESEFDKNEAMEDFNEWKRNMLEIISCYLRVYYKMWLKFGYPVPYHIYKKEEDTKLPIMDNIVQRFNELRRKNIFTNNDEEMQQPEAKSEHIMDILERPFILDEVHQNDSIVNLLLYYTSAYNKNYDYEIYINNFHTGKVNVFLLNYAISTIKGFPQDKKEFTEKETKGVKDYLLNNKIGIDCSGFVSRAIAFVMRHLEMDKRTQALTLGLTDRNLDEGLLKDYATSLKDWSKHNDDAVNDWYNTGKDGINKKGEKVVKVGGCNFILSVCYDKLLKAVTWTRDPEGRIPWVKDEEDNSLLENTQSENNDENRYVKHIKITDVTQYLQPGDIIMKITAPSGEDKGGFHIFIVSKVERSSFTAYDSTSSKKHGPDETIYKSLDIFLKVVEDHRINIVFARPKAFSDNNLKKTYFNLHRKYLQDKGIQ